MRLRERLRAIAAQRCPVCLEGAMFRGTVDMYPRCPVCGHQFERESGFFQGAMYVSYVLAAITFTIVLFSGRFLLEARIGLGRVIVMALIIQMFLVPVLWRYSRVVWSHLNVGTRQDPGDLAR